MTVSKLIKELESRNPSEEIVVKVYGKVMGIVDVDRLANTAHSKTMLILDNRPLEVLGFV